MPFMTRKSLTALVLLLAGAVLLIAGFVWSGLYNVGADDPHTRPMLMMMQTLRQHSIHARSKDLKVPDLRDQQLILKGAGQYAAMCTQCHLAPGMEESEIRPGLYPQPPELSKVRIDPQDAFWVIKHGVKMSAMPAWGRSHDDMTICSMVAFLQRLPDLTPAQYKDIVARAPPDDDMEEGHAHQHGGMPGDGSMPAMTMASGDTHEDAEGHSHAVADVAQSSADQFAPGAVPDAEAVAKAFHAALQHGDRAAVMAVLAPDVVITEDGHAQSREEYAAGHLAEDMSFLKGARIESVSLASMRMGTAAMVSSTSVIRTTTDGKPLSLLSTEQLTLAKSRAGWLITQVAWTSSRQ